MWSADAPWQTVSQNIRVAFLPPANVTGASDEDLQKLLRDAKRRNLALAVETAFLARNASCDARTEAHAPKQDIVEILEKIRRNGGVIDYIAMDEPYYFGHRDAAGCRQSASELASNIADNVRLARRYFPGVRVGDIEVLDASAVWATQLLKWAAAYETAAGEPLAFMHVDVSWSGLAIQNLVKLSRALSQHHIPLGIIYNDGANADTDEAWQQSANRHIADVEAVLGVHPQMAVFSTWDRHPTRMLPEDQPGTLTNVVLGYLLPSTTISLTREGSAIVGQLTDAAGQPIPNARMELSAVDVDGRGGPTMRTVSGVVPADAVRGVIGIRVDTEGACVCDGTTTAVVGKIQYREQGGGRYEVAPVAKKDAMPPEATSNIMLVPGQRKTLNLEQIPVTPNAVFTLAAPIGTTRSGERAGYVTIVFEDPKGKGIRRENIWFGPSSMELDQTTTDASGQFRAKLPPSVAALNPQILAYFAGSKYWRSSMAQLIAAN
jgi:hypothetical protein